MTGVDADLATLRHAVMWRSDTAARDAGLALDRVEAELSRLREQRDEHAYYRKVQQTFGEEQFARAEAAEARLGEAHRECARLQQERDALIERDFWASQTIREQEAELVRLRETLARVRPDIDPETGYGRVEAI